MFEYLDNGRVEVELIGRKVTLRRPNLGEYRTLRSTLEAAQENAAPRANALALAAGRLGQLSRDDQLNDDLLPELTRVREETLAVRDIGEEIRTMWFTLVLTTLDANGQAPREDEYPPDILEGSWLNDIVEHWRHGMSASRPTVPGES